MPVGETAFTATMWTTIKYVAIVLIPFVEPQIAGILGAITYLVVRHELGLASLSCKNFCIVMFFGWMGAWASVNIMHEHIVCNEIWVKIVSASVGFLSYDALLLMGKNTTSIIEVLKDMFLKGLKKWNS